MRYTSCFNALPDILQLRTVLSQETADNLCSLQWHIVSYNEEKQCVEKKQQNNMHRDAGEWRHGGSIGPSALSEGV